MFSEVPGRQRSDIRYMTVIELETEIEAGIAKCFDLSRNIEVHELSTAQTNEKAIAGRTRRLCEAGDKITWEARHFGIRQRVSVEITKFNGHISLRIK